MHGLRNAAAIPAHQRGEIADARGHDRLDAFAQPARQHRRMAAGTDRHDHVAAIDNGGEDERGEVGAIDHVHRNTGVAGARGNLLVAPIASRAHDRDRAGEIGGQRIVEIDLELARAGSRLHDLIGHVGMAGVPAHGGVRGQQQTQLIDRMLARAGERDGTAGDIHENRQKAHDQTSWGPALFRMKIYSTVQITQ